MQRTVVAVVGCAVRVARGLVESERSGRNDGGSAVIGRSRVPVLPGIRQDQNMGRGHFLFYSLLALAKPVSVLSGVVFASERAGQSRLCRSIAGTALGRFSPKLPYSTRGTGYPTPPFQRPASHAGLSASGTSPRCPLRTGRSGRRRRCSLGSPLQTAPA